MRQVLEFVRSAGGGGQGADPDTEEHEFVATVHVDDPTAAVLHLGGLATVTEVLVNGTAVHSSDSMFHPASVDVSPTVRAGDNEVLIRVRSLAGHLAGLPTRPRARWRTMLTDEPKLRWVRTSVLGRAPGLVSGPAAVGPFRPVVLQTGSGPRVTALRLVPSVAGTDGVLAVTVRATGTAVLTVAAGPVTTEVALSDGVGTAVLRIPDVELWWPHTHGEPALYDVTVAAGGEPLPLPGDGTAEGSVRRVGFRRLGNGSAAGRPDTATESIDLHLNGERVFVRGAVWTPGDLAALDEAVALGLNLVRVPGVGAYESDAFHARCDELGLLVWQDLMFATFDYPLTDPGFVSTVTDEVRTQTARLVGHPSAIAVCGSAEHEQQAAMFGVPVSSGYAQELATLLEPLLDPDADVLWVPSSPCGGTPPIRVDSGVAQYFGVGGYRRPLSDVRHARVRFAAECLAFANLPDPVVPGGVSRDNGADWDFADVTDHYARQRYGPDATPAQRQRVTGEVMADVFGEWRRPASGCGGGIVLWLRDLLPGSGWGLLDHAGDPKPAALALAPVLQPTAVWFVDEGLNGLDVHTAVDGALPVEQLLRVELLRADGSVLDTAQLTWAVPGRGHRHSPVEVLFDRFFDASYAYRFGAPQFAAVRAVWGRATALWRPTSSTSGAPAS